MKILIQSLALFALVITLAQTSDARAATSESLVSDFQWHFYNDEAYSFSGNIYTIVNHLDSGWDQQRVSFDGARRLIEYSKKNVITRFGLISSGGGGYQGFSQSDMTFIAYAATGAHKFNFPQARAFLISGGNLSLCLCEVLRDLIHGTEATMIGDPVHFFLVTDAVYDDADYWPKAIGAPPTSPKFTLAALEHFKGVTDSTILDFLQNQVIGTHGVFCEKQTTYDHPNINPKNYKFEIYRGSRPIGTIGDQGRRIRIVLADSRRLDETISAFKLDKYLPVYEGM